VLDASSPSAGRDRAQGVGADVVDGAIRERAQRHLPRAAAAPSQHRQLLGCRAVNPRRRQRQRRLVAPVAQQRAGAGAERLQ